MDFALSELGIPQPNFIKIDVDRIEYLILSGGSETLKGVERHLVNSGLTLLQKFKTDGISQSNQLWTRGGN